MRAELPCTATQLVGLAAAVQRNCDLIDARHARDSGLCTYLLGMREYFRWATNLDLGATAATGTVGPWIAQREQRWEALLDAGANRLEALPLGAGLDAYDEEAVNRQIAGHQLVYGAGIGRFGVPLFFLARRESQTLREGRQVVIAGHELARGYAATPAVSRGSTIVVRLDAFRRWLWTRAEACAARVPADPFRAALSAYGRGGPLEEAVECMARGEVETLILHELGELRAGDVVGPDWERMLAELDDRRVELVVRAVRDLLADCLVTLPALLERRATASLDFWFSSFEGVRRALAPQWTGARSGGTVDVGRLQELVASARPQWTARAVELVERWREQGPQGLASLTRALHPG
jgi:hypothetical protein